MTGRTGRIGVLIVDDSAVVRQVLSERLSSSPDIEVLGCAPDPIFAMAQMNRAWPDVIVLDIEMPRMDGITFLKKIMDVHPTPVVICSTLTRRGATTTIEALAAGAVSIVAKPTSGLKKFIEDDSGDIVAAVRAAAMGNVRTLPPAARRPPTAAPRSAPYFASPQLTQSLATTTERVVAIGVSTGGTQALEVVLTALPRTATGVVIVQHMPEKFTAAFAERLDSLCEIDVKEAVDRDRVLPGRALVAPGGRHMELLRDGAQYRVRVFDAPLVNRHRPSVDVLFRSVAKMAGRNALGIIMTGMGDDGARGLLEMHRAGAYTVAQDEASCVVHGMPKEAVRLGAVDREAPLYSIAEVIRRHG
jgi:two-component system, chemotaxis family, protein-glutamate methylesterase/glutaminase